MKRCILFAAVALLFAVSEFAANAQGLSLFQTTGRAKKQRSGKVPTVITSNMMDIDIGQNVAVFTEKVKVVDEEMEITCEKMTIILEDKAAVEKKPKAETVEAEKTDVSPANDDSPESKKQITKIICDENVIITRKIFDEDEKGKGEQKATGGHADYDVMTGKIVLTKDPSLSRGDDILKGEIIVIWRDSEKIEVHSSNDNQAQIKLSPETVEDADSKDEKTQEPEPEEEDTTKQDK